MKEEQRVKRGEGLLEPMAEQRGHRGHFELCSHQHLSKVKIKMPLVVTVHDTVTTSYLW